MRIFGSDRLKNLMGRFGIPEDQPIENRMLSGAIESAQSKIEGFNFDTRKHLLEYDDVLNRQRKIIYDRRKKILYGDNDYIMTELKNIVDEKELEKLKVELGDEKFFSAEGALMLRAIDMLWVEHLEVMDYMRSSVRLRAYGQRDPLVEYKNEGLRLFRELERSIDNAIAEMALRVGEAERGSSTPDVVKPLARPTYAKASVGRNDPCPCGSGKKYKKCRGR